LPFTPLFLRREILPLQDLPPKSGGKSERPAVTDGGWVDGQALITPFPGCRAQPRGIKRSNKTRRRTRLHSAKNSDGFHSLGHDVRSVRVHTLRLVKTRWSCEGSLISPFNNPVCPLHYPRATCFPSFSLTGFWLQDDGATSIGVPPRRHTKGGTGRSSSYYYTCLFPFRILLD